MKTLLGPTAPCHWTLGDLFARAEVPTVEGWPSGDVELTTLTDDSRSARPGCCFVAVRGTGVDGHRFAADAARAGASVIVVDRVVPLPRGPAQVRVADTRAAVARLAAAWYGLRGKALTVPRLTGITGTNGKTTVAWLLRSILQAADRRAALVGTIEYDLLESRRSAPLTTPGPLALCRDLAAARDAGASDGVLEVSSHALDQRRCEGLSFSVGVFTNLSGDHLDYHGTMEAYAEAKHRLFDALPADAVAVVPHGDPTGAWMVARCPAQTMTYGFGGAGGDVRGRIERQTAAGSDIVLAGSSFEVVVHLRLIGQHNVSNALAAAAAARALGVETEEIRVGLEQVTHVPGRLQRVDGPGCPFTVLVDYAHTDEALASALAAVRPLTRGRLICVFGCGGDRDRAKRPRMAAAACAHADVAYVTSDNPRTESPQAIIDEILGGFEAGATDGSVASAAAEGLRRRCRVESDVDRRGAIGAAIAEALPGDTVLIAGKGHETVQLVGDAVLSFDDVAVARDHLTRSPTLETVA